MEETLFQEIIARKIPANIAYEDDEYIAIHDISPQAPLHLLIIPKRCIPTLNDIQPADTGLVGGLYLIAKKLMKDAGYTDYRTVFNCGPGAAVGVSSASARFSRAKFHLAAGVKFPFIRAGH